MGWSSDEEEVKNAKPARNLYLADNCSDSHAERSDGCTASLMRCFSNAGIPTALEN